MKVYLVLKPLFLVLLLCSCGQTGPLYLPDAPPPIHTQKAKPDAADETKKPETELPDQPKSNPTSPK